MLNAKTARIALSLSVVAIAGVAWFLVSPLLIDETVDEPLVLEPPHGQPTAPGSALIASSQQRQEAMAEAAEQPDRTVQEAMTAEAAAKVIRQGRFRDADAIHRGSGDALLYRLADGSQLLRLENFRVTNGPALVIYLARHPDPAEAAQVTDGYLSLGKLKGNVGNQNYAIPAGTDLSGFNSAVIWCELFGVLFSTAPLTES